MATEQKAAIIIPLNCMKYATERVQCQMTIICDGLWGIVSETEHAPGNEEARDIPLLIVLL